MDDREESKMRVRILAATGLMLAGELALAELLRHGDEIVPAPVHI